MAARLQQVAKMGDRVAILMGNSPEYIFGFVGAMYAGMVPVPLYDPNEPGHEGHLTAVFADFGPQSANTAVRWPRRPPDRGVCRLRAEIGVDEPSVGSCRA